MTHEIILSKNNKQINITNACNKLTWTSHIDALATELSFNISKQSYLLTEGDQLTLLSDKKVLNYYIVVTTSNNSRNVMSIRAYDRAYYLNKNEIVIQFRNASATDAIAKLLNDYNVKHNIVKMNTLIKKIYKGKVISDIILDILDQVKQETGRTYRMEMDKDTLVIFRESERIINPYIRLSDNTYQLPISKTISNPSLERSIEELKNSVIVTSSGEDNTTVYTSLKDESSINKYGLFTEVVTVDGKNKAQARNIAKTTLSELNRVTESISCEMLGHDDVQAGRIIELNEQDIGLIGKYLILSAKHILNNGIHKVSVDLKKVI